MGRRRVLVTGAGGRIGTGFWRAEGERYALRLADRDVTGLAAGRGAGHEVIALDVADLEGCRGACAELDTVVHLAADPSPEAGFYDSLLENNIKGTYNVFMAAREAGCRRVVFASSGHAVAGYPDDAPIRPEWPVRPANMYGVSKCFGEAVASCFAGTGLSSIAVRIGAYEAPWIHENPEPGILSAYLSVGDMNRLLVRCIEVEDVGFAIVHGISNNRRKRFDLTSTRDVIGYEPVDDGFDLLREA